MDAWQGSEYTSRGGFNLFLTTILDGSLNALFLRIPPCRHLLAQSQQWKHQNNVWNLIMKTVERPQGLWTDFIHCSGVSVVDFEQLMPAGHDFSWASTLAQPS